MSKHNARITRRELMIGGAAAMTGTVWPRWRTLSAAEKGRADATLRYLESCRKEDGGYGWHDQERGHLTVTHAVIGGYRALGVELPAARKTELAEWVKRNHPLPVTRQRGRDLPGFVYEQAQALVWLGDEAPEDLREHYIERTKPSSYPRQYETHGYPIFGQEVTAILGRALLGLPMDTLSPEFVEYVKSRRRENGSYNNTPGSDGSDGHVMNTWWGLQAEAARKDVGLREGAVKAWVDALATEAKPRAAEWLRACQFPSGGFTWQPGANIGAVDDVTFTWAAVKALRACGGEPKDREKCVAWLWSLRNDDGGFGDRPGWPSNPVATFHAIDALASVDALEAGPVETSKAGQRNTVPRVEITGDMKVYTALLQGHGKGSPADAVEMARAMKVHLWGAKNSEKGWIERAQQIADARGVKVTFFVGNEEYGTLLDVPGLGTYSHISDLIAPPEGDIGPSTAGRDAHTWDEFDQNRIEPLERGGGRVFWQFGENEELVRVLMHESVERGGYAAISTFHFGNPDFTDSQPFLYPFHYHLPFVSIHDAHGNEPWWWTDQVAGFRTLFIAPEPTYGALVEAMDAKRTAAARFDDMSGNRLRMHGRPEVLKFIAARPKDWQWWAGDGTAAEAFDDMVSVAALKPGEPFENGAPADGVDLRIRTRWRNTKQGLPKTPMAELVSLSVAGQKLATKRVEQGGDRGGLREVYEMAHVEAMEPGVHRAEVELKLVGSGEVVKREVEFVVMG